MLFLQERRRPYRDDELKKALMENLFHKQDDLIFYSTANYYLKQHTFRGFVNSEEETFSLHRLIWESRVNRIYDSIAGFARKPRLGMEWDHHGDLYIQLCW